MVRSNSKSLQNHVVSPEEEKERLQWDGFAEKEGFYRAMLGIRGTSHGPVSVCLSVCVCLSQAGVLLKRQNVGSRKQHRTISQGL